MVLYNLEKNVLNFINNVEFESEKEIHSLTEKNLEKVFNLEKITSEFSIENSRFDTLAFDNEKKSFIIIEYKKTANNTDVFTQGMNYLNLLLNNIDTLIVEYNEVKNKKLKRKEVDKSQSRVILVSQKFSDKQKQAINFIDLPIELWEINKYEKNIIEYKKVNLKYSKVSLKDVSTTNKNNEVLKEIKIYTEEDNLSKASDEIKEFYSSLKERVLDLNPNIELKQNKCYIAFKNNNRNIIDIELQKNQMKVYINLKKGKINDPKKIVRDVSCIGTSGNGDYELTLKKENNNLEDMTYLLELIKQSYKANK